MRSEWIGWNNVPFKKLKVINSLSLLKSLLNGSTFHLSRKLTTFDDDNLVKETKETQNIQKTRYYLGACSVFHQFHPISPKTTIITYVVRALLLSFSHATTLASCTDATTTNIFWHALALTRKMQQWLS